MAGDKKNARHQAIRTLTKMIDDLRSMRRALGVDREGFDEKGDRKGDDFSGYKSELNDKLRGVRSNIEKLNEMRKKLGGERDPTLIALQLKNTKDLKSCIDSLNKLKSVCDADEKKTGKKALEPAEIHDRRKYLTLLAKEIEDLSEGNSTVKMNLSADEQLMADKKEKRLEEQRKEREAKRAERRKGRERRKGKGETADADDVELKPVPSNAPTEQELAFYDKVNENMADQDQMLDEISGGLAEIKQLALKAQKELAVQEKLLDQVDEKMDNVNNQFKSANQRLADLLEQTGGMSRWCPIIVLGILFVALLGYIFYIRN